MAMLSFGGIDVPKDRLDVMVLPEEQCSSVPNDAAGRYQLLTSMPGVGPVLACRLIALLPELGRMNRKQVAALVGLAPYAFDSGKLKGARCIWGGRASIRRVLYMAALIAMRCNPALKAFHNRLAATGKKPKVVIVRKMIITLNAMLRNETPWVDRSSVHEGGDARPLARQKWIGNGQDRIRALTAEREECPVEVTLLRRLDDLEIEMQRRCRSPRALDGDNAKRIRRIRQHRDPREVREQLFQ